MLLPGHHRSMNWILALMSPNRLNMAYMTYFQLYFDRNS